MQLTWVWVCCHFFKEVHVVAFRRSPNLRDLLVRALNSPTTTAHPSPLQAHSAATPEMAASSAYTLTLEKQHTFSPTQEKQDKLNITLLTTQETCHIWSNAKGVKNILTIYIGELNAHFVNALKNIDRQQQQQKNSTQTPQQQSLPTLINLATRSQTTWNLFRGNRPFPSSPGPLFQNEGRCLWYGNHFSFSCKWNSFSKERLCT